MINVTRCSVTLMWTAPKYDGGHKLTGYMVEKLEAGTKAWAKANHVNIQSCAFTVTDLTEGAQYEFRIRARNAAGAISNASEPTELLTCKDEYGRRESIYIHSVNNAWTHPNETAARYMGFQFAVLTMHGYTVMMLLFFYLL